MRTYKDIVEIFETAANEHEYVESFAHGSLDFLDSSSQNVKYPYVFLRPIQMPGLVDGIMTRTFELYCLDIPKLSNESPLDVMSNMERVLNDIGSYFNRGPHQQQLELDIVNVIPTLEAFNDRAYGWVGNVNVVEAGIWNYCIYPSS